MQIIFFTHPDFLGHKSMPRFAKMLVDGMQIRGHQVEVWSAKPQFYNLPLPQFYKKWLSYIDQYLVFPQQIKKQLKTAKKNTLFVLTDHALGPWLPLIANLPHVVHCHDFLAQQSALNLIPENPTSWTGKQYQAYIHRGYSKGKNFISVSKKTQQDLHNFIDSKAVISEVVYNGLNQSFQPKKTEEARKNLSRFTEIDLNNGYLLHIGGNQWYKNRLGVVEIYYAWRNQSKSIIPLLLIGENPDETLKAKINGSKYQSDIYCLNNVGDDLISDAYAGAISFIFPSLAEGFGWPIAEAMACGCPVITTNEAPMIEVAGDAALLIPKQPLVSTEVELWADIAAKKIEKIVSFSDEERAAFVQKGLENAKRFDTDHALDQIENIYKNILQESKS